MATIFLKAELTPQQIIEAIGQLDRHDLERITRQTLQAQAKQKAEVRYEREAQILAVIFEKKPVTFRRKFERLRKKQRTQNLNE